MPVSRANGLDIYYEKAGSGPALALLHAMPFDHNLWLYQIARFSSRFTTLALDLRAWGRSAKPTHAFTLRDMADDVMGVLADEGVEDGAVVIGCSVGSKIALMLALDHPDVFDAGILVGGQSGLQPQFEHRVAAYRAHAAAGTLVDYHRGHLRYGVAQPWGDSAIGAYLIEGFVERAGALDAESIARVFAAVGDCDLTPRLASLRVPILIVNGEHDNARAGGERTATLIPEAWRRVLPATGHCCFIEDPDRFDAFAREFLVAKGVWPQPAGFSAPERR